MSATQIILLEKIESLGNMGDVVSVKPGYARNFLLPQRKALRATQDNIAYFEAQKAGLEKANAERKKEAEKLAAKLNDLSVVIVRQASESGQLYGSVTARDIAEAVASTSGEKIERRMVTLNQNFKTIGLFPMAVVLHPEVKVMVTVNVARSPEEAKIQAKTGKALIAEDGKAAPAKAKEAVDMREELMDKDALEATKAREAEEAKELAEESAKSEKKSKVRAEKKAAKATEEGSSEDDAPATEIGG